MPLKGFGMAGFGTAVSDSTETRHSRWSTAL